MSTTTQLIDALRAAEAAGVLAPTTEPYAVDVCVPREEYRSSEGEETELGEEAQYKIVRGERWSVLVSVADA